MRSLWQDMRYSVRMLVSNRMVTMIAIVALALGIGANTAIFSVVEAVLLRPLPYHNPEKLVAILRPVSSPVGPAEFLEVRREQRSFDAVGAVELWSPTLSESEAPVQIVGQHMSEEMFSLLGVAPVVGRTFSAEDFDQGKDHVAVIGYGLWQRQFGGSRDIVGQTVRLDQEPYTVIGVMPKSFRFAPFWVTQAEIWAPFQLSRRSQEHDESLRLFARLKPGVSQQSAQAELDQIARNLEKLYPQADTGERLGVYDLQEKAVGKIRPALEILLGAVGLVLLIACANVANLSLARATARQREVAIRTSMGASRWRIVRLFLTESVLLAITGAATGLLFAQWGTRVLQSMLRPDSDASSARLAGSDGIGLDTQVLWFTLGLAVLTGIVFGIAPALAAARGESNDALKEGGRGSTSGSGGRLRRLLVVAEVAIALVMLIGAGLLMRTFVNLRAVDPGFNPENVITFDVSVAGRPEYIGASRELLYRTLSERVAAIPGVLSTGEVNHIPLAGDVWGSRVFVEGHILPPPGKEHHTIFRTARPNYFSTMGIKLLEGRDFNERDTAQAPGVVVINETLARHEWPGEDPIGKRLTLGDPRKSPQWLTVIGELRDLKQGDWISPADNELYLAFEQSAFLSGAHSWTSSMTMVVRTGVESESLEQSIESAVRSVDHNLPISHIQTFEHAIGNQTWQWRFNLFLIGLFAAVALALAMVGIYGVLAYEVTERTHEIGIRMALGAERSSILKLIARQSLGVVGAGIGAGLVIAAGLVRLMRGLLYGVQPFDVPTFLIVALGLVMIAALAALSPVRRATRVDPMIALRHE